MSHKLAFWRRPDAVPAEYGVGMGVYDFEVLKDGAVIAAEQTVALPDTHAAWPKIAELARAFDEPGHKIRVKDETGKNRHPHWRHGASPLRQRGLDWLPPAFVNARIWRHVKTTMINDPEKRLNEALKNVDAHGDAAPPHIHDPMTVLRGNAIQAHLMHLDDARGRYALTGAGRRRISPRGRARGTI